MISLLLSGGLDSTALAYMYKPDIAFNINYGQRAAEAERRASHAICQSLSINLINIDIDCSELGSGDLTNRPTIELAPESDWWPFRNQLLITLCAMKAVEKKCKKIMIGTVKSDQYHTDGTPEFIQNINQLLVNQEGRIRIEAPAIKMTATELIKNSKIPFELLAWSHSCHKANIPCANCRGCNKHYSTLNELGLYND
ncbi:7-cyano-7-deazaguanine synthase [Kiloniella majae]|uniref:7-cyano-7-deazaguanine synthase n=1 Tax=Kiloniella majae TaxID=1938558 RepID=UPI000A277A8E|nr:7-cyano-7-deazaguanine synthase [Kiloniella majae]